jgi:hypothetical protein
MDIECAYSDLGYRPSNPTFHPTVPLYQQGGRIPRVSWLMILRLHAITLEKYMDTCYN